MAPTSNPFRDRSTLAFAHQGGALEAPSSTVYALDRARSLGCNALELDVHRSSDGVLVVCHDETVDRTTQATGPIDAFSWEELQAFDNAYWFVPGRGAVEGEPDIAYEFRGRAPDDPHFGIARLDDVFDRYAELVINLDIKRCEPDVAPYDGEVIEMIRRYDRTGRTIVASFHDVVVERVALQYGDVYVSAGPSATAVAWKASRTDNTMPDELRAFAALQVPVAFGGMTVIDQRFVDAAHATGLAVHAWTIDRADEMESLLALGVDGIISDCPSVLAEVLRR